MTEVNEAPEGASSGGDGIEPLLKLRGIDKHFGPVQALYGVNLDLPAGQVTGLCGDNGAGKSVLTRTIAGVHHPDHGQIYFEGRPVHVRSTRDAAALGIETVYQDLALADNLDIVQNMFLGRERDEFGHHSRGHRHALRDGADRDQMCFRRGGEINKHGDEDQQRIAEQPDKAEHESDELTD